MEGSAKTSGTCLDVVVGRVESRDQGRIGDEIEGWVRRLKETGSCFLIVDWDHAYDVKPVLDRVFGSERCLRNEIIWVNRRAQSSSGAHEKHFTIFWYVKDPGLAPFVKLTMPRSLETRKRFGDGKIISSVSVRTGRRAPARVDGESLAAPLNDVWVWDHDRSTWVYELEEIDGRAIAPLTSLNQDPNQEACAEDALFSRLLELSGARSKSAIATVTL